MEGHHFIVTIKDYLQNPAHSISILYSPAHLMDSRKQFQKTPDLALAKLAFLSQLTSNTCLLQDIYTKEVRIETQDPVALFHAYSDLHEVSQDLGDKTKLSAIVEDSGLYEGYKNAKINYFEVAQLFEGLPIDLTRTKENPTLFSLMCDLTEQIGTLATDGHALYKKLRDKMKSETAIADKLADHENPLALADRLLSNTDTGKFMKKVMTASFRQDPQNREETIASHFMDLDSMGYRPDKLNTRHGYMSIATDAQHTFYASYCDVFLTQDDPTAAKAKAVYKYLQLSTKVLMKASPKTVAI